MKNIALGILFICIGHFSAIAQSEAVYEHYPIIPYPSHLVPEKGNFIINQKTSIVIQSESFRQDAIALKQMVKEVGGINLVESKKENKNCIIFKKDNSVESIEGYHLSITPSALILSARTSTGLFWGVETIRQLLPVSITAIKEFKIPSVEITDKPAYGWRGMHLDVARHFFSVDYLKKFIDRMAMYKLNRLHLHLTDDQGWRIQIKKYPQLTEKGAWRAFDGNDSACMKLAKENPDFEIDPSHIIHRDGKTLYGGFYTQDEMRNVIKYAASRNIEIIPELDMPGHMMAAIKIFHWLSCTGQQGQGKVFSVPLCPCKETTFQFAENVYKEIFALFPSKYVHIGGDEVDKSTWETSSGCNNVMQKEGIKNVNELQSYFIKRMEKYFHENGKKMIAWDDVLEGGIDSSVIIMYWRGWVPKAPVEAANNGNKVIMTPGSPLYFDQFPDKSSLYNVYHFDPIPKGLSASAAKNIIGIQACVWTERIPSEKRADFMTMPRMTAMAEVAWTDSSRNYSSYLERLKNQYRSWDKMHIHYRLPDLTGFTDNNVFIDSAVLTVQKTLPNLIIHYTMDGTLPNQQSPVLPEGFLIDHTVSIKLAAFTPGGNRGDIYSVNYSKETYVPPVTSTGTLQNGLKCIYYKGSFSDTKNMTSVAPSQTFNVNNIAVPSEVNAPTFGLQYRGYIDVPENGIYSFYLTSDDGSLLTIDGKTVVDNDGLHSAIERSGEVALEKGLHLFSLDFIEGGGGYTLRLLYGLHNSPPVEIPSSLFKTRE
ncbi:MAG: family 20 glycosylhydrolase [Bacteroidota bacterium]|nr:family 20 glycosylhydrolase [Bacteroidota bacterium]